MVLSIVLKLKLVAAFISGFVMLGFFEMSSRTACSLTVQVVLQKSNRPKIKLAFGQKIVYNSLL